MSTAKRDQLFNYSGDAVKAVVAPLTTHYNLHSFVYKKVFQDGSEFFLGTHPDWFQTYFNNELYRYNVLELEPDNYVKGHILWSQISTHTPILEAVKDFKIANGLTAIRPQQDGCEFFYLGGAVDDKQFGQVLMNNIDLMEQFFNYFKYQAKELIARANQAKIIIPNKFDINQYGVNDIPCYQNTAVRKRFLHDVQRGGLVIPAGESVVQLTPRELAVARELLLAKTMVEISEVLFISPRTVETHINHLKSKLKVQKRSELIEVLRAILI